MATSFVLLIAEDKKKLGEVPMEKCGLIGYGEVSLLKKENICVHGLVKLE